MIIVNYIVSIALIALGLFAVCTKKNLIKVVLGLGIIDYGINLLIVSIGYVPGGTAPIYTLSDFANFVWNPVNPNHYLLNSFELPSSIYMPDISHDLLSSNGFSKRKG